MSPPVGSSSGGLLSLLQGVFPRQFYGTSASLLWLELRGPAASQATAAWNVYRLACHRLLPWLQLTFAMVPDAAWPGSDQGPWGTTPAAGPRGRLGCPSASNSWGVVCCGLSICCRTCVRACGVCSVCCVACAFSLATWLLFTGVRARCAVCAVSLATWLLFTSVPA